MNIKYRISENDYKDYLQATRKQKMKKPGNIILTLILSVMPVALFIWGLQMGLFQDHPALIGTFACILSVVNLFFRLSYWKYTGAEMRMMQNSSDYSDHFKKEHSLTVSDKGLTLSYGKKTEDFSWETYGGILEFDRIVVPVFNGQHADIIPAEKLSGIGGTDGLKKILAEYAAAELRHSVSEQIAKEETSGVLCTLEYIYSKENYLRDQMEARRTRYITKLPYNKSFFAKISIIAVLIYALTQSASVWLAAVYSALIFIFALEYIIDFSPLLRKRLEKMLVPTLALMPLKYAKLTVRSNGLIVSGDIHYLVIPWEDVLAVRETKHAAALYLASSTILTVPAPPETNADSFRFFVSRAKQH